MGSRVAPGRHSDAPARRGRLAATSALALAVAAVGVTAATAGETPAPPDGPSTAPRPAVTEAQVVLQREPQRVGHLEVGDGTSAPAWLRRSPGDLPADAAMAYLLAARTVHAVAPHCGVTAPVLAGLGRVLSDHGRLPATAPRGPARPDTDGGRIDHDPHTDRPVGPMRMLPATWAAAGVDADGDGVRDPRDINDAALAAAVYLCAAFDSGPPTERVDKALTAWDGTPGFVEVVRRLARAYASERYAAVWDAGRAGPLQPRAYAVLRVTHQLASGRLRVRTAATHRGAAARAAAHHPGHAGKPSSSSSAASSTSSSPSASPTRWHDPWPAPSSHASTNPSTAPPTSPTPSPSGTPAPTPDPSPDPTPAPTPDPSPDPPATPEPSATSQDTATAPTSEDTTSDPTATTSTQTASPTDQLN